MSGARVSRCSSSMCGMRYPSPDNDPRRGVCPRCEAATVDLGPYPPAHDRHDEMASRVDLVGVLDNVRSALNVGTMLRASDGARVTHMHLCGLTPEGDHPKVAKTSLGAESTVPWTHHHDGSACVADLAEAGCRLWVIESTPTSRALADAVAELTRELQGDPAATQRLAIVVGNETAGVDPGILERCSEHVHLPMAGAKTTLNVGVAFGAVIYAVRTAEALA